MKKTFLSAVLLVLVLLFSACVKEDHKIRFDNQYHETLTNVRAGTANIGTVNAGDVSEYVAIPEGKFTISGSTPSGDLQGSGTITGKGKTRWTLVLLPTGVVNLIRDKK